MFVRMEITKYRPFIGLHVYALLTSPLAHFLALVHCPGSVVAGQSRHVKGLPMTQVPVANSQKVTVHFILVCQMLLGDTLFFIFFFELKLT